MKLRHEQVGELQLPDFLLVGAAKSATTSLHVYLDQHPQIFMPAVKESWFFSFLGNPPCYAGPIPFDSAVTRLEDYARLFEDADPEQKLGDASPSYLYTYEDTIRNIRSVYPAEKLEDLRIIISLREPVSRAFSQYWTFKRHEQEPLPFEQAVDKDVIAGRLRHNWSIFYDYTGFGRYYEQVKAYMDAFGRDRVLIVLYDDIQNDPVAVCRSIFGFIGVDSGFAPKTGVRHNSNTGEARIKWPLKLLTSRNPAKRMLAALIPRGLRKLILFVAGKLLLKRSELSADIRQQLAVTYSEEIDKLEVLIGRDLSQWRKRD